jgi:3-oxoacyl-[acyl-carrier protein] reductase
MQQTEAARLLNGKNALVTGGGRGVGFGIARSLVLAGCNVAINYKDAQAAAEASVAVAALRQLGVEAFAVMGDVKDAASVTAMFADLQVRLPTLDLLVNNAGIQVAKPLLDLTEDDWDSVMDTNAKGAFLCTQAAARIMKQHGGGSIVNIGSGCSKVAFPRLVSYAASKGAIEMLTRESAYELGPFGIRVNCVAPGAIRVERTLLDDPDYESRWGSITPLRRGGQPDDVGDTVVYFASHLSRFVTGQTLWVDGGVFTQAPWPYQVE